MKRLFKQFAYQWSNRDDLWSVEKRLNCRIKEEKDIRSTRELYENREREKRKDSPRECTKFWEPLSRVRKEKSERKKKKKKETTARIELFDSRPPLIILIHRTYVLLPKRGPLIHHISSVSRGQPVIYHKIWGLVPGEPQPLCNGA